MELLKKSIRPADLKKLKPERLPQVAAEVRAFILDTVSKLGGHLASSLGATDITVALHYAFETPKDRLVWDTGHQTYAHKILTGRRDRMAPSANSAACQAFSNASSRNTTRSARVTPPRRSPQRSAWPWLETSRVRRIRSSPSSRTAA